MSEKSKPKPDNIAWVFFLIVGLLLSLAPAMIQTVWGETVETKDPSMTYVIVAGWNNPIFAYTSNDQRASTTMLHQKQGYGDYNFTLLDGDTITKVEIGVEGYITSGNTGIYISWDNGTSFNFAFAPPSAVDTLFWHDVTSDTTWNNTLLDNNHLKASIYHQGSSGCYGLDAEVGLWEGGVKFVRDVEVGDVLTGWNVSKLEIKGEFEDWNITQFVPAKVVNMTLHYEERNLTRIIVESEYRQGDFKDVLVTEDHILPYFKVEYNEDGSLDKIEMKEQKAEDFGEGDYVFGFIEASVNWTTQEIIPAHLEPYHFFKTSYIVVDVVADIQTNSKWFMGHYLLAKKEPWTGYVDWLPVRVTYTPAPPITVIAPLFIGALVFFLFVGLVFYLGLKRKR